MSLIIYRHGRLTVDRSGEETVESKQGLHQRCPVEVKKFYLNRDLTFAVVFTGAEVDFSSAEWKKQLAIFHRRLMNVGGGCEGVSMSVCLLSVFKDTIFFLITSQGCYELENVGDDVYPGYETRYMRSLDKEHWTCHGSARDIAQYLLSTKPDVETEEIFRLAAIYTPGLWETELDSISMQDLKPFKRKA